VIVRCAASQAFWTVPESTMPMLGALAPCAGRVTDPFAGTCTGVAVETLDWTI
jgi:hypothetical protein